VHADGVDDGGDPTSAVRGAKISQIHQGRDLVWPEPVELGGERE